MQVSTLLSVMSSAVVVAALSSSVVQMQATSVVVAAAPAAVAVAAPAPVAAPAAPAAAAPAAPVAAPAHPAYVKVAAGAPALSLSAVGAGEDAPTVDVLACTKEWSDAGECLGEQAAVLRDVAVETVQRAVQVPAAAPHLRVSVHGGEVSVALARP